MMMEEPGSPVPAAVVLPRHNVARAPPVQMAPIPALPGAQPKPRNRRTGHRAAAAAAPAHAGPSALANLADYEEWSG
ncbi:MAG: hypothetical protein P4L69_03120 [Desulfosporosinus sp.]|nr:hypothetical protein [Desulfosporosinus sp.]